MPQARTAPAPSPTGLDRRERLARSRLYLVTDDQTPSEELPGLISAAVRGGVDMVQLRRKRTPVAELEGLARSCLESARDGGALFLLDDHVELAVEVGADGAHVGQSDLAVPEARALLGPDRILGLSTHDRAQVLSAAGQPVDYISAGPVYPTPTKPGRPAVGLEQVRAAAWLSATPVVAIGGLAEGSSGPAIAAGADMVGVVRAICSAADPESVAAGLRREVESAPRWLRISANGRSRRCLPGSSVADLLEGLGVGQERVVVERNGEILRGEQLDRVGIEEEDQLEIVHLVGGGAGLE